jgi:hypothetical protein
MAELAKVYGVARQTMYTWRDGGDASRHMSRLVVPITLALMVAVKKNVLPLRPMDRMKRAYRVEVMARTLQNMKPAPVEL